MATVPDRPEQPSDEKPVPAVPPGAHGNQSKQTRPLPGDVLRRVVEIDLPSQTDRAGRDWQRDMLGKRGSFTTLLRDLALVRPVAATAPPLVRLYRDAAREAFLWARDRAYGERVVRWRALAPLVAAADSLRHALGRPRPSEASVLATWNRTLALSALGVRSADFHRFGLDSLDLAAAAHAVSSSEAELVHLFLHRRADFKAIDDCVRCCETLLKAGIRTPINATVVSASSSPEEVATRLPLCDLFLIRADEGDDLSEPILRRAASGDRWHGAGGPAIDRRTLAIRLVDEAGGGDIVVRKRLSTGGSLVDLEQDGLCTVQVVTLRPKRGARSAALAGVLRLPGGKSHGGKGSPWRGIAAPIVREDGRVGVGRIHSDPRAEVAVHPITKAAIAGRRIDEYAELAGLACAAHELFPDILCVGWELAVTERGPMLLKGNVLWDVDLMQSTHRRPLLATEYGDAVRAWLGP